MRHAFSPIVWIALGLTTACALSPFSIQSDTPEIQRSLILWCDATANLERLGSADGVRDVLTRAAAGGVTGVVIDIRPISGHMLIDSPFADRLERWPRRGDPSVMIEIDTDFDVLAEACAVGHGLGLQVFASMNVFSDGHKQIEGVEGADRGRVFGENPDWAGWDYMVPPGEDAPRLLCTTEHATSYTAFVSPHHPEVRARALNIIRDVVERYPIDGIVLDRVRYDGIQSDFSPWARADFEQRIGHPVERWPEDIMTRSGPQGEITHGPLWDEWLLFRAQTIHDFIVEARDHIKAADPQCIFGDYVGAWYPLYWEVGVNWASPRYEPRWEDFPPGWSETGYADELDLLFAGTYFYAVTPEEVGGRADGRSDAWLSVEGSARLANAVVLDACPVFGSLYVEQYKFESPDGEFDGPQFGRALRAADENTAGLMIFDLVHLEDLGGWGIVEEYARSLSGAPTTTP